MTHRKHFGGLALTVNQLKVLYVMRKAADQTTPRWITAAEIEGAKMPSFYRLRHFGLVRSRMTPGGRLEPRHGLIWTITDEGRAYLDKVTDELNKDQAA